MKYYGRGRPTTLLSWFPAPQNISKQEQMRHVILIRLGSGRSSVLLSMYWTAIFLWKLRAVISWFHACTFSSFINVQSEKRRVFAPGFVNYKKGCTRLAAASDKVYQLLAHGRWFSPVTPASSTTKTGRHDIAEILLKVTLNTKNQSIKTKTRKCLLPASLFYVEINLSKMQFKLFTGIKQIQTWSHITNSKESEINIKYTHSLWKWLIDN